MPNSEPTPPLRAGSRRARLALLVGCGLALRVAAAVLVTRAVLGRAPARLCIFPDADIYWLLARALRTGSAYQVSQWGVPHYALRTPGYPLFLAACQWAFGENPLAARLVQAGLGAGAVWLAYALFAQFGEGDEGKRAALWGAALVALDPYTAGLSALLLSEALFVPLLLLALLGVAVLWRPPAPDRPEPAARPMLAAGTGLIIGAALLVRPSWALFLPFMLIVWVAATPSYDRRSAAGNALLVAVGTAAIMAPWWVRNAHIYGRFVPTALWVGPSLYDGLNPAATGASDMDFLSDPKLRTLDESTLDRELRARAWSFAREHPARALTLALVKAGRFWSPWPNAESLRSPLVAVASALVTLPVYALLLVGLLARRRDAGALLLLAGTLVAFWLLHMVFVGSVRYRIPGMVPAMGLAGRGACRLAQWVPRRPRQAGAALA